MLRQRSISAVAIVLIAAVPAIVGGPVFVLVIAAIAVVAGLELVRAFGHAEAGPDAVIVLLASPAFVILAGFQPSLAGIGGLSVAVVLVSLATGVLRADPRPAASRWAITSASALYVGVPLAHAVALRETGGDAARGWVSHLAHAVGSGGTGLGLSWFALALSATWLTDTGAYLVGRAYGRTKLAPRISPGKTIVGAVAGVAAGTATGAAAAALFGVPIPWYAGAAVGFLLAVVGQIGDLSESLVKRSLGIKDMSTLIPGHGGVLDRIDALLFTMPLAYWLARVAQQVRWP